MRNSLVIACLCSLLITSCTFFNNKSEASAVMSEAASVLAHQQPKSELDSAGTVILIHMLNNYYALKNAMVTIDTGKAKSISAQLITEAGNMETYLKSDSAHLKTLQPYADTIITQSRLLAGINDKTCEKQRIYFDTISMAFIHLMRNTAIKNAGIYVQHCPMAFNEKGADWLSNEIDIKNPYFGNKMLECGEVTDSMK